MSDVPKTHPRYFSLTLRDTIVEGVEQGITSIHGLIAHGRGEAFDYLIGETTHPFAIEAIHAAAVMLCLAEQPIISVNGNVAALAPDALIELAQVLNAPLEVNIFHTETGREQKIRDHLLKHGAPDVLMPTTEAQLSYIDSNRKFVHPDGIFKADVVFVPLEDGDRCEALRKMGKDVVTVDLNPLSRTAKQASITIVDNVVRALPLLCEKVRELSSDATAQDILKRYSNAAVLQQALQHISRSGNGNQQKRETEPR
ncbi:phosphopantothenate/pantothenate synthetase [Candidatus Poribacteria bacterium]|nr:phosphopantothenate/pantothenate synthetase [Candidatus Poribacteria bacterium]